MSCFTNNKEKRLQFTVELLNLAYLIEKMFGCDLLSTLLKQRFEKLLLLCDIMYFCCT